MRHSVAEVERALRGAVPDRLVGAVRSALRQQFAAIEAELFLADYAMTVLLPVDAASAVASQSVNNSPPGRAFGAQAPHVRSGGPAGTHEVHVPVSVRGDRLGVLSVTLPGDTQPQEVMAALEDVAAILGRELVVAERHTDRYATARRAARLTLASEMQWQLLPGSSLSRPECTVGGQLEPAYALRGDNFDWSVSSEHLTLSLTNGMGEGIEAALLTSLAVNALRNGRRAGVSLADQAYLADQALYGQYGGAAHVSTLLLRFSLTDGSVEVIDAGSPKAWRMRDGRVEPLPFEAQLPLGMFEDTHYQTQTFQVLPGDRLLLASDGVYDVLSAAGERYQERALANALRSTQLLPPTQVPQAILRELEGYRQTTEPDDDAMLVCLDWHGRT
ncbi:PP2C family protein-serine/threonine phosphatase [Streptomyces sp. CA-132043]|uniref:PP2C family protein-serine/threonine phosphatase n=1 Tax=Streptomyces sp. CA-132043 TaxID=3240048 RepID=UPI003D929564